VRLLLDTHIWLWSLLEPSRLSSRVSRALRAEVSQLWLSPLSIWEFILLVQKGRVVVDMPTDEWISMALGTLPVREAPLTLEAVLEGSRISLPHADPVDRFLAGTARAYQLTLVTADARLIRVKGLHVLANR
jgi:PIN domain nuclease of toxin-antitoxin system